MDRLGLCVLTLFRRWEARRGSLVPRSVAMASLVQSTKWTGLVTSTCEEMRVPLGSTLCPDQKGDGVRGVPRTWKWRKALRGPDGGRQEGAGDCLPHTPPPRKRLDHHTVGLQTWQSIPRVARRSSTPRQTFRGVGQVPSLTLEAGGRAASDTPRCSRSYCPPVITSSPAECTLSPSSHSTASFRAWPSLPAASVLAAGPQRQPESQQRKPAPPSTPVLLLCKTPGYQDGASRLPPGEAPRNPRDTSTFWTPRRSTPAPSPRSNLRCLLFRHALPLHAASSRPRNQQKPRHGCDAGGARCRSSPSIVAFACPTAVSTPH